MALDKERFLVASFCFFLSFFSFFLWVCMFSFLFILRVVATPVFIRWLLCGTFFKLVFGSRGRCIFASLYFFSLSARRLGRSWCCGVFSRDQKTNGDIGIIERRMYGKISLSSFNDVGVD